HVTGVQTCALPICLGAPRHPVGPIKRYHIRIAPRSTLVPPPPRRQDAPGRPLTNAEPQTPQTPAAPSPVPLPRRPRPWPAPAQASAPLPAPDLIAFQPGLDPAIGQVARPAMHAQRHRLLHRALPIPDTLHLAADQRMQRDLHDSSRNALSRATRPSAVCSPSRRSRTLP